MRIGNLQVSRLSIKTKCSYRVSQQCPPSQSPSPSRPCSCHRWPKPTSSTTCHHASRGSHRCRVARARQQTTTGASRDPSSTDFRRRTSRTSDGGWSGSGPSTPRLLTPRWRRTTRSPPQSPTSRLRGSLGCSTRSTRWTRLPTWLLSPPTPTVKQLKIVNLFSLLL